VIGRQSGESNAVGSQKESSNCHGVHEDYGLRGFWIWFETC